jgi:hypothetical protein
VGCVWGTRGTVRVGVRGVRSELGARTVVAAWGEDARSEVAQREVDASAAAPCPPSATGESGDAAKGEASLAEWGGGAHLGQMHGI